MLALHPAHPASSINYYTLVSSDPHLFLTGRLGQVKGMDPQEKQKHEEWNPNEFAWDPYLAQAERVAAGEWCGWCELLRERVLIQSL